METMVKWEHKSVVHDLKEWVKQYCSIRPERIRAIAQGNNCQYKPEDVFIGYDEDIISSLVLGQDAKVNIPRKICTRDIL